MTGQMKWMRVKDDGPLVLHVRMSPLEPWVVYTSTRFAVSDYDQRGSKGWTTYQNLLKAGFQLIPTADGD
jgi:hypothetical protein